LTSGVETLSADEISSGGEFFLSVCEGFPIACNIFPSSEFFLPADEFFLSADEDFPPRREALSFKLKL